MTVTPLGQGTGHGERTRVERNKPRDQEGEQFSQLIRKRRSTRGRNADEAVDEAAAAHSPALEWLFAMTQTRGAGRLPGGIGTGATPAVLVPQPSETDMFPQDAEVIGSGGRAAGSVLTLRIAGGPWVGLEMQASLHAGSVVMSLRPANRAQEKRLKEVKDALTERLREQTGAETQLEIADAAG